MILIQLNFEFPNFQLSISGYSHKQQVLLAKVIDQMFNFEFCPKRFEIIKEQMHRALKNFNAEQPYQHAVYYLALILTERAWTKHELIDAVSRKNLSFFSIYCSDISNEGIHLFCSNHGGKPERVYS